jgi:hypothetical protein
MASRVDIILIPDLRSSAINAVGLLHSRTDLEVLLLDFPETLEDEVNKLAEYRITYEELIRTIRQKRILPEPLESWTYTAEPILRILPRLRLMRPELEICCYAPAESPFSAMESATRIARLAFRVRATGKVETDEWREAVASSLTRNRESLDLEFSKLAVRASGQDAACLAGLNAFRLKQRIAEYWDVARVRSADPFYYRTPLEVLLFLFSRREISDEQLSMLALAHVEYVYRYVLASRDRDEAHKRWVQEKIFGAKKQDRPSRGQSTVQAWRRHSLHGWFPAAFKF